MWPSAGAGKELHWIPATYDEPAHRGPHGTGLGSQRLVRNSALAIVVTALVLLALSGFARAGRAAAHPLLTPEPGTGEQCGNCLDDDADGLTDAEDPECCPLLGTLDVRRLRAHDGRIEVRALLPEGLDPTGHEIRLTVSREAGPLLCREATPLPRGRGFGRRSGHAQLRRVIRDRWALQALDTLDLEPIGALRVTLRVGEVCLGSIALVEPPNGTLMP